MSPALQDLLFRLLSTSPALRPTVQELFTDPWFASLNWTTLQGMALPAPSDVPWQELQWKPKTNFARMHLTMPGHSHSHGHGH